MFWNKKEIKKELDSEEYKKLQEKFSKLFVKVDMLEIEISLLTQKLSRAVKTKAIINKESEEQEETKSKNSNSMMYY